MIVVGNPTHLPQIAQFEKVFNRNRGNFHLEMVYTGFKDEAGISSLLEQLSLREPEHYLDISEKNAPRQTAAIIHRLTEIFDVWQPDLVIAPGDASSTVAAAITARQLRIPFAHLDSGLRSFDRTESEEHNRMLADTLADYHWVSEPSGEINLNKENKGQGELLYSGNTRVDTLVANKTAIASAPILKELQQKAQGYALLSLKEIAEQDADQVLEILDKITEFMPLVCSLRPAVKDQWEQLGIWQKAQQNQRIVFSDASNYFNHHHLLANTKVVVTNKSDDQEASTYRRVPCLTLKTSTSRLATIRWGTNTLIGYEVELLERKLKSILANQYKAGSIPKMWDGKATERIVKWMDSRQKGKMKPLNLMGTASSPCASGPVSVMRVQT